MIMPLLSSVTADLLSTAQTDGTALLTLENRDSTAFSTRCTAQNTDVLAAVAELDYQMYNTLQTLPGAIATARASISEGTGAANRDKLIVGLSCLLAAVGGKLGVLYNQDPLDLTIGQQLSFSAYASWGYGYWAPFLMDIDETDPGCGIEEFNKVVSEYSFVTSLHSTYGDDGVSGGYSSGLPDDRPELRAYYLGEFGRKLKLELHCITSQAGGNSDAGQVVSLIDKYVRTGQERLDLTGEIMKY